jgi:phage tail-like protein
MGEENAVYPNYSFKLEGLKGAESGLKFYKTDLPTSTVEVTGVKAWDGQGKPSPLAGGGHQVKWNPINMTRYMDESTALWDWFKEVSEKGATSDTRQEPTITCLNNDQPLFMWKLTEAVATGYSQNGADAHSSALLEESITISFTGAELTR